MRLYTSPKEQICSLQTEQAIEVISRTEQVFYRHGVWNEYRKKDTAEVVRAIRNSGYGADVYRDGRGNYYVSIPCDGDMW